MKYKALLKVFLFIILFVISTGISQLLGLLAIGVPFDELMSQGFETTLTHDTILKFIDVIVAIALVSIFFKIGDKKNFLRKSLSVKGQKFELISGSIMPIAMVLLGFLVLWGFGWVSVTTASVNTRDFLLMTMLFICVAIAEEVVVRGYVLHTLMSGMNKYAALFLSSILFSLLHLANPNSTMVGFLNLFLAGMFLGIVYTYTKNLWFAITAHFFWNYMQSPLLGFNVSGKELPTFLEIEYQRTDFWTGGAFGFEGSVICSILLVMATVGLDLHYRKQSAQMALKTD